jgi:hypothetical protein
MGIITFPFFIVLPFLGIIFLIIGISTYSVTKRKGLIIAGAILVMPPFLFWGSMALQQNRYERNVVGHYAPNGYPKTLLILNDDKTFTLSANPINKSGNGKWAINNWDIVELDLAFEKGDTSELTFEFTQSKGLSTLKFDPFGKTDIRFVKQ